MDRSNLLRHRSVRVGALAAAAALMVAVPAGFAQTPEGEMAMGDGPHPAHIHAGTCESLGDVVAPLTDVAMDAGEAMGPASAVPTKQSRTTVDLPLAAIIEGGHAINVHLSADEIGTYIACGDIGGVVVEDDGRQHLVIGLRELNDSGHVGVAWLGSEGEAQTEVVVTLIEPEAAE
jgi:hypothetical protein